MTAFQSAYTIPFVQEGAFYGRYQVEMENLGIRFSTLIPPLVLIVVVLASCGQSSPATAPTPTPAATPTPVPSAAVSPLDEGDQLFESGQFEKAIDAFTRAIALNSQPAEAYRNRGAAYFRLGQYQRSIQDYDQAIRINPQDSKMYAGRAIAYTLMGNRSEARRDVDRAVELGFDRATLERILLEAESHR